MLVKLASADVYLLEYDAYHCIHISSFNIISSSRVSQELITLLHPQLLLSPMQSGFYISPDF